MFEFHANNFLWCFDAVVEFADPFVAQQFSWILAWFAIMTIVLKTTHKIITPPS